MSLAWTRIHHPVFACGDIRDRDGQRSMQGGTAPVMVLVSSHAIPEVFRAPAAHYTGGPARRQTATSLPRRPAAPAGRPAGPAHAPQPGPVRRPLPPHPRTPGGPRLRLCGAQPGRAVRGGALRARPGPVGDCTCLPKSGRKLPGVGWRWHGGEGRVAWGQQPGSCPSWT